jgi:hypothetical protein
MEEEAGKYLGEWIDGQMHGLGEHIFKYGDHYLGEWNSELRFIRTEWVWCFQEFAWPRQLLRPMDRR